MLQAARNTLFAALLAVSVAGVSRAQTGAIEGDVKADDGAPLRGALVKIDRTDIKGSYKVKTDKKGHYFHAGLPMGTYRVTLEVDGKDRDTLNAVRVRLGDPTPVHFDLQAMRRKQESLAKAAESGTLTQEQAREMTPEQRAAMEKQMKERSQAMAKNKALNDAFNTGMEALKGQQWDAAIEAFSKAAEMDAKQHVIWAQLADAYSGSSRNKSGADLDAVLVKALDAFSKAIELKPDDAAYHNNYAIALARGKKITEAQAELTKAAQIDPPNAGRYYFNLGAVLVNTNQTDAAGEAFKKAIDADPNYSDAWYQYGIFLTSKASTTADGKINFPPGTKEAFEKYLQLKPDGPYADGAKGMLATMTSSIETQYTNPATQKKKKK